MHEGDEASFFYQRKTDLNDKSQQIDINTVVIDCGWLLRKCTWRKGDK